MKKVKFQRKAQTPSLRFNAKKQEWMQTEIDWGEEKSEAALAKWIHLLNQYKETICLGLPTLLSKAHFLVNGHVEKVN